MVGLLARRLGATTRGAILAALGFAFGTIAPVYSRLFFADPLLALLTVAGIYFTLGDEWRGATAAALLAVLAKPTGIVLGPCLGGYLLCKRQPAGRWIAPLCGTAVGLLIYFAYNWARFANPFDFGQPETFALRIVPYAIAGLSDFAGPRTALVLSGGYRRGGGAGRDLQAMGRQVDCGRGRRLPGRAFDLDVVGRRMVVGATAAAAGIAGVDGARWASRAAAAMATGCTELSPVSSSMHPP